MSNRQIVHVQIGTPSTSKAICADSDGYPFVYQQQPTQASTTGYSTTPLYLPPGATTQYPLGASGWYAGAAGTGGLANGGGNTSADQGHPVEYYFGKKGYNKATSTAGGTQTQDYFLSVPAMVDFTTANSGGGIIGEDPTGTATAFTNGICFYNVVDRNNTACGGWPALTTGGLTQGTLAIWVRLITVGAAPLASVTTNYTIIYRATDSDPWQAATPSAIANGDPADSPNSPGTPIGVVTSTTPGAAASEEETQLYFFDTPGEYVVRNNGFVVTPGQPAAHAFMVNFWDAHEGTRGGTECTDCTGPS